MDNIGLAVVYGAVQGLTEFLPVSSSGHLVLLHSIADLKIQNDLAFDVALHLGTLVAVISYFFGDLVRLLRGWIRSFRGRTDADGRLAWWLLYATIPAAILGYLFESKFEQAIRRPEIVAVMLIVGGVALWVADRTTRSARPLESLGWKGAVGIGFSQALALVPGVSRSGATIIFARVLGLSRASAARFSFLLSVPIIAGAGLKSAFDISGSDINVPIMLAGIITAAVVGYIAIRWMLRYVQRASFGVFALYRFIIGIAALIYFGWIK